MPGTPLREDRIAEEFHVSSTPVREAFRRLEFEGWLQSIPYRGCFLRKFSRDEICEHYQLREMLEGLAAASAAQKASPEDIEALRRVIADEKNYIDENSKLGENAARSSLQPDFQFHQMIAEISHNTMLQQRLKMLNAQISSTFILCHSQNTTIEDNYRVYHEHVMIFSAIERRWDEAAEVLMRQHIREAKTLFLAIWDQKEAAEKPIRKRGRKAKQSTPPLSE